MTGDNRGERQAEHVVTGSDPVADGPHPEDRVSFDEQDVAGVDQLVSRYVGEDVALRVAGSDLLQDDRLVPHAQFVLVVKSRGGQRESDALEVECAETMEQELASIAHVRRLAHDGRQPIRGLGGEFPGGGIRGDDLRLRHELVAVAVIGVGMGVHQFVERLRGLRLRRAHALEHRTGEFQVEQGVHEQTLVAVHDQSRVAPAPSAVRLDPRVAAVANVVQTLGERPDSESHWRPPVRLLLETWHASLTRPKARKSLEVKRIFLY